MEKTQHGKYKRKVMSTGQKCHFQDEIFLSQVKGPQAGGI